MELGSCLTPMEPLKTKMKKTDKATGQESIVARPPGGQQLHRDGAVEQYILAAPDLAHAAGRDPVGQPVAAC